MKRAIARMIWLLSFAAAALFSLNAAAEPVSAGDAKAARSLVEAQLDAFANDDAQRAFSFAAPAVREMFGTPDRFMAMVRGGYPVVYRPASVTFLRPVWVDRQLVQGVQLTDAGGTLWLAIYSLERQPDRSWRISGCNVQPAAGKLT